MSGVGSSSISNIRFPGGVGATNPVGGCRQCSQGGALRGGSSGSGASVKSCSGGTSDGATNIQSKPVIPISNIPSPAAMAAIRAGNLTSNYQCLELLGNLLVNGSLGNLSTGAVKCSNATIDARIVLDKALMPGPTCTNTSGTFQEGDTKCVTYDPTAFVLTEGDNCPGNVCGDWVGCVQNGIISSAYDSQPQTGVCVWVQNSSIVHGYSIAAYEAGGSQIQIGTFGNSSGFSNGSVCAKISVDANITTIDDANNNYDCNVPSRICANATGVTIGNTTAPASGTCVWYNTDTKTVVPSVIQNTTCSYQPTLNQYITGHLMNAVVSDLYIESGFFAEPFRNLLKVSGGLLDLQNAVQNLSDNGTYEHCSRDLIAGTAAGLRFIDLVTNLGKCCLQMNASMNSTDNQYPVYQQCEIYACDPNSHLPTNVKEFAHHSYWGNITC